MAGTPVSAHRSAIRNFLGRRRTPSPCHPALRFDYRRRGCPAGESQHGWYRRVSEVPSRIGRIAARSVLTRRVELLKSHNRHSRTKILTDLLTFFGLS